MNIYDKLFCEGSLILCAMKASNENQEIEEIEENSRKSKEIVEKTQEIARKRKCSREN